MDSKYTLYAGKFYIDPPIPCLDAHGTWSMGLAELIYRGEGEEENTTLDLCFFTNPEGYTSRTRSNVPAFPLDLCFEKIPQALRDNEDLNLSDDDILRLTTILIDRISNAQDEPGFLMTRLD